MNGLSNGAVKQNIGNAKSIFGDYLIMLAAPCFVAFRFYGARSLLVLAASVAAAVITDALGGLAVSRKADIKDLCSVFSHGYAPRLRHGSLRRDRRNDP